MQMESKGKNGKENEIVKRKQNGTESKGKGKEGNL